MRELQVTVSIVTFNSAHWLRQCLDALERQTMQDIEVLVWDNHSRDDSAGIAEAHPRVTQVFRSPANKGFGQGNNELLGRARGRCFLALNADVILEEDALEKLLELMDSSGDVASVSGILLQADESGQRTGKVDCAGHHLYRDFSCRSVHPADVRPANPKLYAMARQVFGAPGAAAMYRTDRMRDLGGFDARFFAYWEDVDLDARIALKGWRSLCAPNIIGQHFRGGRSQDRPAIVKRLQYRNALLFLSRHLSADMLMENRALIRRRLGQLVRAAGPRQSLRAFGGFLKFVPSILRERRATRTERLSGREVLRSWTSGLTPAFGKEKARRKRSKERNLNLAENVLWRTFEAWLELSTRLTDWGPAPEAEEVDTLYVEEVFPYYMMTFLGQEIRELQRAGRKTALVSLRQASAEKMQEADSWLVPRTAYLTEHPWLRLRSALALFLSHPGRGMRLVEFLQEDSRGWKDWRLLLAEALRLGAAAELIQRRFRAGHLTTYFAYRAPAVTGISILLDLPCSFGVHASDISVRVPRQRLKACLDRASFVRCSSVENVERLVGQGKVKDPGKLLVLYGSPSRVVEERSGADQQTSGGPGLKIITPATLEDKKGIDTSIDAIHQLVSDGMDIDYEIVGSGPLQGALKKRAGKGPAAERIRFHPRESLAALADRLTGAHMLLLLSRELPSGRRDGIPVSILEAMVLGLPIVSTTVSGIPEAVEHGVTGLLVEPDNPWAAVAAIRDVASWDEVRLDRCAQRARAHLERYFDFGTNVAALGRAMDGDFSAARELTNLARYNWSHKRWRLGMEPQAQGGGS